MITEALRSTKTCSESGISEQFFFFMLIPIVYQIKFWPYKHVDTTVITMIEKDKKKNLMSTLFKWDFTVYMVAMQHIV